MSFQIERHEVEHVARLARLSLTADEVNALASQLTVILEHAAQVSALDTTGVEPTAHPFHLVNVLRPDVPRPGIDRDEVLRAAPSAEDGRFRVPRILDAP